MAMELQYSPSESTAPPPVPYEIYKAALDRQGTPQALPSDEVVLSHGVSRGISHTVHLNELEDQYAKLKDDPDAVDKIMKEAKPDDWPEDLGIAPKSVEALKQTPPEAVPARDRFGILVEARPCWLRCRNAL